MKIEFPDGKNHHSMWALMDAIEGIVAEILPKEVTKKSDPLREAIETSTLIVTGGKKFVLHAKPGRCVIISNRVLDFLWVFVYAHAAIYDRHFAGEMKKAGNVNLEADKEMNLPREMLTWMHSTDAALGLVNYERHFPLPNPKADRETLEGKAYHLVTHAIRFILLHELSHVVYEIEGDAPKERIQEEANCDLRALEWMQFRKATDESDNRRTKTGAALALLVVAAIGIETGEYDGVDHPLAYHRPLDTLRYEYGRKDQAVWGLCLAVLAQHCSNVDIEVPWEKIGYDEFQDGVRALVLYIDEINDK